MSFAPTSPVTGAAQTGFTAPTFTLTADIAPANNAKQFAVTAIGGTVTGADVHSVSKPFTHTFFKPAKLATLPQANVVSGVIKNVGMNRYKLVTRKGASPAANQIPATILVTTVIEVPAGVDTFEPEEIRAALSSHIGILSQQSAGVGDTTTTGLM